MQTYVCLRENLKGAIFYRMFHHVFIFDTIMIIAFLQPRRLE